MVFLAPSFLDTLNSSLELAVTVLGPLVAVYAVDIALRRNSYDGRALNDERSGSPFWYRSGIFWPGVLAMVIATTTAALMANTTLYVGPISAVLGGADLSAIVGPLLAGGTYAALWRTTTPYRDPAARPTAPETHTRSMIETDAASPMLSANPQVAASVEHNREVPA